MTNSTRYTTKRSKMRHVPRKHTLFDPMTPWHILGPFIAVMVLMALSPLIGMVFEL